ncbi:hypothetical protein P3L10_021584 [Capsicum annuum]
MNLESNLNSESQLRRGHGWLDYLNGGIWPEMVFSVEFSRNDNKQCRQCSSIEDFSDMSSENKRRKGFRDFWVCRWSDLIREHRFR